MTAISGRKFRQWLHTGIAVGAALMAVNAAYAQTQTRSFNIPAGDLGAALKSYGATTGTQIIYDPSLIKNRKSAAIRGNFSSAEALTLILAKANLSHRYSDSGVLMIYAQSGAVMSTPDKTVPVQTVSAVVSSAAADPAAEEAEPETVVVTGIRSSMRSSMMSKKNASEVVDSIVAQDIGKLPDPNLADTLSRVPGVQLYRFAGEGVYASVRGLVDQNRTEYNGRSAYTPDSAVGGGRDFQPDNAMPEIVSGIDIFKNPSAERIEGAIGGLVNIKTYKPFDFKSLTAIGSVKLNHYDLAEETKPAYFGLISNRWQTQKGEFGALLAASYSKTGMRQDAITTNNNNFSARPYLTYGADLNGNGVVNSAASPNADRGDHIMAPNGFGQQMLYGSRERKVYEAAFAWRPSDTIKLYLDATRSEYVYDENNPVLSANLASASRPVSGLATTTFNTVVTPADVANGSSLAEGSTIAGYNLGITTFSGVGFSHLRNSFSDEMNQSIYAAGGAWQVSDKLNLSGEIGYTDSEQIKTTRAMNLITDPADSYTVTQDLTGDLQSLSVSGGTAALADPGNWFYQSYGKQYNVITVAETAARFDVRYDFDDGEMLKAFKAGARVTDLGYVFDRAVANWTIHDVSGTTNANLISLASTPQLVDHVFDDVMRGDTQGVTGYASVNDGDLDHEARLLSALPSAYRIVNGSRVNGIAPGNPALDPTLHFEVDEQTAAVYGVVDFGFDLAGVPVDGNAGARVIKTEGQTRGFQAAPQGYDYIDVLPSLNARAELNDNLFLRLGLSKGVTRPGFKNLNPSITTITTGLAPGSTPLVTIGNPDLKPQSSKNYDLSLEYYFSTTGYTYASLFHKDVEGFITNFQQFEDLGFTDTAGNPIIPLVTRPINGASGKIDGAELGVQMFFDSLPVPWNGLGIQANYTYVNSAQDVPLGSAAAPVFVSMPLTYLSENAYNLVLMYEQYGLSTRLAYGWRDEYLRFQFGGGLPNVPVTTPAYGTLDLSANYKLSPEITLTAEATNLLDTAPDRYADGLGSRPVAQYTYDRRFALAVRYRFGG